MYFYEELRKNVVKGTFQNIHIDSENAILFYTQKFLSNSKIPDLVNDMQVFYIVTFDSVLKMHNSVNEDFVK